MSQNTPPGSGGPVNTPAAPFEAGYVVAYNPVPMAHAVAQLASRLWQSALWFVLGLALWGGLWWWQREKWGMPWVLIVLVALGAVRLLVTLVRLLQARRNLGRISQGPALESGRSGLRLHTLEGAVLDLDWDDVKALRVAGLKLAAGPELVVEARQGKVWSVPLSFLDALPGTIDGGVRATSAGRHGLDLSGLDRIF
ncbi:hypothetical protein [Luteococcus sp. OSA5]|uniref:hypothetical protein n=1 Tax=Luteococcus sp. OSA5 TaxID=3401630 RepID=UPI003B42FC26